MVNNKVLVKLKSINKALKKVNKIDIIDDDTNCLCNKKILCKNLFYKVIEKKYRYLIDASSCKINLKCMLSRNLCSGKKLLRILNYSKSRNLGEVPFCFMKNILPENRKDICIELYNLFAKYSLILNYDFTCDEDGEDYIKCRDYELAFELSKLINQKVEVTYTGHGCFGNGFRIKIGEQSFFYKVFYLREDLADIHGCNAEIANAVYANKNGRKGQFVKFCFGRMISEYEKDGFMINEFVENQSRTTEQRTIFVDYLTLAKSEIMRFDNSKNGKIIDFGALKVSRFKELENSTTRRIVRVICNHITFRHDMEKIAFDWRIGKNNFNSLKRYAGKLDYNEYLKAVNIIRKTFKNIPPKLIKLLQNIKTSNSDTGFQEVIIFKPKDLFCTDLNKLKRNLKKFSLKILTESEPMPQFNALGNMIVKVTGNSHFVIRYDNKIREIRIEEIADGHITVKFAAEGDNEIELAAQRQSLLF